MRWRPTAISSSDPLLPPDFIHHEVFPDLSIDREGVKQFFSMSMMHQASDGFRMDVEDMLAEGDQVVARTTMKGVHRGEFMGVAATGKTASIPTIDIVGFTNGNAVEHWGVTDGLAMLEQFGALPDPA